MLEIPRSPRAVRSPGVVRLAMVAGALLVGWALGAIELGSPLRAQQPGASERGPDTAADRIDMILGGLPPPASPGYAAIRAHAGRDARGQALPLTRCELWSVRRTNVEAVRKAAEAANVSVKVLDATWNQVLAPMPAGAMDDKSKAMMDMAMKSKATAGMGMMSTRLAPMVEYALTKGMVGVGQGGRRAAAAPSKVIIGLNEKTSVSAVRRSVEIKGDKAVWRGVVEGTENPVTIMWWGSGRMSGTINTGDRVYQLKQISPQVIGVIESMADRLPDEHARVTPQRMIDLKMKEDTFFMKGDSSAARPRRENTDALKDEVPKGARTATAEPKAPSRGLPARNGHRGAARPEAIFIDVMVVYTAKAAAHYDDIRRDLIELAVEDTNESFRRSGIDGLTARLAHVHQTDYDETGAEHFDHVWRMVDRDRFMEEVPRLRDEKKADVVVLIVDDATGCGLATRVAAAADEAYAVVHHECAATSFSIPHEIGHLLGARHDRSLDKGGAPFDFGHGFVSPDLKWRTMMSYKAGCNGCPRLPIWSTPARVVGGKPAGDTNNDNARVIRERAATVAGFR